MGKKELQRYSLRKSSLGAASVLLGTAVLAVGASNASADEVATTTDSATPAVEATDAVEESTSAVADSTEKKVVNVTEEGNTTVTTSEVTNTSLEAAKTAATNEGVEVKEEPAQTKETVEAAVELAETGHLVISTLHTAGSVQTITRLVNFFHPELQHSFRYKLWDILFWVLSQRLIPKIGWGRAWIYEVMMMTPWIKNLIRSWDLVQINNAIEMWRSEWMVTMKTYADNLSSKWIVKEEDYINYFQDDM